MNWTIRIAFVDLARSATPLEGPLKTLMGRYAVVCVIPDVVIPAVTIQQVDTLQKAPERTRIDSERPDSRARK